MIPVCEPVVTDRDIELVVDCLRSGWVSSAGKYIEEFEARWSAYCDMPYGVSVCNGTAALQIAIELLDLNLGDEVILPSFTIISPALAVVRCGGRPVLVDSTPDDWQMDVSQIAARITPRTRAILVVHAYGHPADMDSILEIARRHQLVVIEDAAEVHGAEYRGRKCGGLGDISAFSFYANKLVTTGEGGMVLLRDARLAERARGLRNLCFHERRRFHHEALGYNFRLTNMQAALGIAQIERIDQTLERKRAIATVYRRELRPVQGVTLPTERPGVKHVYWVFGILVDDAVGPEACELRERLAARGVDTRPFFLGMHEQPVFQRMGLFKCEQFPVAERLARQGLYLPNGLSLADRQITRICQHVKECLDQ